MPKIKFEYIGKYAFEVCERPKPSNAYIPKWYKDMPQYFSSNMHPSDNRLSIRNGSANYTAKKCTPMLDAIITGYTIPLWSDVLVEQTDDGPYISWRVKKDVFEIHGSSSELVGPPTGYSNFVFKFLSWLRVKTPPGYSTIVRSPAGHYDLPFQAIPAIVDTDKSVIDNLFPVWLKSDFEGIVEKGTPMVQLIPFKRDNWESEFSWITDEEYMIQEDRGFQSTIKNNYIKNIWSKKGFK